MKNCNKITELQKLCTIINPKLAEFDFISQSEYICYILWFNKPKKILFVLRFFLVCLDKNQRMKTILTFSKFLYS